MQLPAIGQGSTFGGNNYPDKKEIKLQVLEHGFNHGINLVDTGEYYEGGLAERVVGEFIRDKRNRVIVSTKFKAANNSYHNVIKTAIINPLSFKCEGAKYVIKVCKKYLDYKAFHIKI